MTRIEALRALEAKVESEDIGGTDKAIREAFGSPCHDVKYEIVCESARMALRGSLDAAKSLHNAVLPGWGWSTGNLVIGFKSDAMVWDRTYSIVEHASSTSHVRAFLLAIIRALITEEQTNDVQTT